MQTTGEISFVVRSEHADRAIKVLLQLTTNTDYAYNTWRGIYTLQRTQQPGSAVMGLYEQGGIVFTTGCTEWAKGVRGEDPVVEQITRNILNRLSV